MRMFHEPRRAGGRAETTGATAEIACAKRSPKGVQRTANWPQASPQGGFARAGKTINITEDVRKYAAEQGLAESEALESGMQEKRKEFAEKGGELYAKA